MKLEPMKKSNLPRYAAALACLSFAPALTGCSIVQPDGMMEVYTEPVSTQPDLAGEAMPYSGTDYELDYEGDEQVYSGPDSYLDLAGDEPVYTEPEPEMTAIPPEELTPERFAWCSEIALSVACDSLGLSSSISPDKQLDYADQRFEAAACIYGKERPFSVCYYIGTEQTVYDRNAEAVEGTFTQMFGDQKTAEKFEWGFVDEAVVNKGGMTIIDEYNPVIFIDCADGMPLTAEKAEQILREVFGEPAAQTTETEAIS